MPDHPSAARLGDAASDCLIRTDHFSAPVCVPVAIVGAGACGLTAALRVREAGVDCVLIERDASPAGSTALSSGFIPACGTALQRAAGISDPVEQLVADIQHKAQGRADPALALAYAGASGPALDWLQSRHGLPFELLDGFLYPGHSVRRMHAMPERSGAALLQRLLEAARRSGAMLLTQATVRQLAVNGDGRVLGLVLTRPDGSSERIACDCLVLACNGYGGDPARVARHLPALREAVFAGHAGNDGSALRWGEALGAAVADLSGAQGHGAWAIPHGILISWALMMRGGVQINQAGERFHDETGGYSEAAQAVLAQPGAQAWCVFDESLLPLAEGFPDFQQARAQGAIRHASGESELATLIGCDPARLSRTLAQVAAHAGPPDQVTPDPFGRRFERALTAPFLAVRVTGALFHTQGGLAIDARCRVLRADGTALPNLLAAGGAARGVSGDLIEGYLSGNGLLSAVAGGYLAGATAVEAA